MKYLKTGLCIFIAFVFIQSLFFKFSGSPETEFILGTLGEWSGQAWFGKYGAYMVGIVELIASILLFTRFHALGAFLAVGTMTGAIFFHLFTPIGVAQPAFNEVGEVVGNDGGTLFVMACLVWLAAAFLLYQTRKGDREEVD
ncbi:hypothetical protein [Grimontia marina]|uniref:DoxX n=1 Tax=Grimontia marina TaxID=646534 RepID=A0A128FBS7_9GAMM|nr:hypothetical protein [Grimontia marina]CZF83784.1 hypothetical protein GMA8713_02799 [Grimontia marina]